MLPNLRGDRVIAAAVETVLELEPQRGPGEGMGPCKETGNYPVMVYLFGGVCLSYVPPCLAQSLCLTWVPMGKGGAQS